MTGRLVGKILNVWSTKTKLTEWGYADGGGQVSDTKCLNPDCNYIAVGEVCTKCGKSQSYMSLESERDELKKGLNMQTDLYRGKLVFCEDLKKLNGELSAKIDRLKAKLEVAWKHNDELKKEFDSQQYLWKSRCEALELEKKLNAHVSLRIMTAKAEKLAEVLSDIAENNGPSTVIKAKAALAEFYNNKLTD